MSLRSLPIFGLSGRPQFERNLLCDAQTNARKPGVWRTDGTGKACTARHVAPRGTPATTLRRTAKRAGWVYVPGYRYDFCPEHCTAWRAALIGSSDLS